MGIEKSVLNEIDIARMGGQSRKKGDPSYLFAT